MTHQAIQHTPPSPARRWRSTTVLLSLPFLSLAFLFPISATAELALLVISVALLGMPHGAYDWWLAADRCRSLLGRSWWLWYILAYVGIGGLVIVGWYLYPVAMTLAFLAVSCVHFGAEDLEAEEHPDHGHIYQAWARGAAVIATCCAVWSHEVSEIFAAMIGYAGAPSAREFAIFGSIALLVASPALIMQSIIPNTASGTARLGMLGIPILLLTHSTISPVLGFAWFFAAWHSLPHTAQLVSNYHSLHKPDMNSGNLGRWLSFLKRTGPQVLLVTLAGFALVLLSRPNIPIDDMVYRVVFVGLSAVAIPHMLQPHILNWIEASRNDRLMTSTSLWTEAFPKARHFGKS